MKQPYFTKLDPELREAMRRYKAAVGVPEAQQIDRALREWLDDKPEAWLELPRPAKKTAAKKATRKKQTRRTT